MNAGGHPTCPNCDEEIDTFDNEEVAFVSIADGVEWKFGIKGNCPACGDEISVYGTAPQAHTPHAVPAIDVGATLRLGQTEYRVENIYIDEDGEAQVTIQHDDHAETVAYDDIRKKLETGEVVRTNGPHAAYEWRQS